MPGRLDDKVSEVLRKGVPEQDPIGHIKRELATADDPLTIDDPRLLLHVFKELIDANTAVLVLSSDGRRRWQLASPENQAQQIVPTLPLQRPRPMPPPQRPKHVLPKSAVPAQPVMPMLTRAASGSAKPQHSDGSKAAQLDQPTAELQALLKERTARIKNLNGEVAKARKAQAKADQRANKLAAQVAALKAKQDFKKIPLTERLKVCYSILFKRQLPTT